MKCLVINYDTKEQITVLQLPKVEKGLEEFINQIYLQQKEKDVLGLGNPCSLVRNGFGLGINSYFRYSGYFNTMYSEGGVTQLHTSGNSFIYGNNGKEAKAPDYLTYYDELGNQQTSTLRIGMIAYPEGYVLKTGKTAYNIFGSGSTSYFDKITSKNFKSVSKENCRKFTDLKSLLKYIQDNIVTFKFMSRQHGYQFAWEYASPEFEKDMEEFFSNPKNTKKKASEEVAQTDLETLLEDINNPKVEATSRFKEPKCDIADEDMMKEEAIDRMLDLKCTSNVLTNFKQGTLMQSEAGGILYYLNDDAKEAVRHVKEDGFLPYHVVVNGDLYSVLYVSPNTKEWENERPDRDGIINDCYVYNARCTMFSETGSVKIESANGGLVRSLR